MKRLAIGAAVLALGLISGCATRSTGLSEHAITIAEREATYRLYVPTDAHPREQLPLLVALHRFTEDADTMARMTGFDELAEREGFAVVYPDGPGRRFDFSAGGRDDAALVLGVIDDVRAQQAIDDDRVYLTGASNGGFMTFALACTHPERFAAIAPVMAVMPRALDEESAIGTPMPTLIVYGTTDRIVPMDQARIAGFRVRTMEQTIDYWRARNGCEGEGVDTRIRDSDTRDGTRTLRTVFSPEGDSGAPVVVYKVLRGGHTWPGGDEPGPAFIVGRTSRDFSASEAIWAFFERRTR